MLRNHLQRFQRLLRAADIEIVGQNLVRVIDGGVAERDPMLRVLLATLRSWQLETAFERAGYELRTDPRLRVQPPMVRVVRNANVKSSPEVSV